MQLQQLKVFLYTILRQVIKHYIGVVQVTKNNLCYSDSWCDQGSSFGQNTSTWASVTFTLLKKYKDTNYTIMTLGNWSDAVSSSCKITAKTVNTITCTYANNLYTTQPSVYVAHGKL